MSTTLYCTLVPVPEELFQEPDRRIYLSTAINSLSKWNFYDPNDYTNPAVSDVIRQTRQVNHVSFKVPPSPLLSQLDDVPKEEFCEVDERWQASIAGDQCTEEFCNCIQTFKVQIGEVMISL